MTFTPDNALDIEEVTTTRPTLTMTEAADAAGVSRRTIRRRLDAGDFPGAVRDTVPGPHRGPGGAVWRIPVDDLLTAGFQLHAMTPGEADTADTFAPARADDTPDDVDEMRQHVEDVERQMVEWRERARVAEAVAEERGRALDDARLALRALTAGTEPAAVAPTPEPARPRRLFDRWRS